MKSRISIALTFVVAFAAICRVLYGCGRIRGDDTTTTIEPVLVFNEPVTVGDLERNPSDPFLQMAPDGEFVMSWTEQEPGAKDDGRNFLVTTDDSNLYVAWTERKGETSLVKMQTAQLVSD